MSSTESSGDSKPPQLSNATDDTPTDPSTEQPTPADDMTGEEQRRRAGSVAYSPGGRGAEPLNILSPGATDRVFPIRSVVSMDPTPTPTQRPDRGEYFPSASAARARGHSESSGSTRSRKPSGDLSGPGSVLAKGGIPDLPSPVGENPKVMRPRDATALRAPPQVFSDFNSTRSNDSGSVGDPGDFSLISGGASTRSNRSTRSAANDELGGLVTARFKHVVTDGGHAIVTGRDGETLQRCEDEPIQIPGAIQGFGLLIALQEDPGTGNLLVRIVSENSKRILGWTPKQLFALENFCDILSEEQTDNLLDHIDFIRDEDTDVETNGPEVFTMAIKAPEGRARKLWCAMHSNDRNPGYIICEFELEDDVSNPLVPNNNQTPDLPEDTLSSNPTEEEYLESTQVWSRPLRVLRSARKRKGEAAAMEVFNIMSQVQEQLATAPNLEKFLKVLVGVVKELTGFHRVMVYQFDAAFNGRVVTELVDPRATKDLYKGLNFPASDIPKQARDMYKINRVRLLYDRDQETARLVCRTLEDLENPLDLTHSYLRAMSPIHIKYLANMAVRSSMSISINAFNELWGLIACHSYGPRGMRVSFPIRKMCRLVGDSASRNIERLSYASRLQARKLINTVPTQHNPSGYIIASSDDLLKLFDADYGLLSIRDETKILGHLEQTQECLAMLEYLRMRKVTSVTTSTDVKFDFPDLRYPPGFSVIAGMLVVPLSASGHDFIVFFRKGQLKEVKWAGNPYEKFVREGTEGYLEPRKSFKTWSEMVVGKSREWTEEEIETAAVLCLVYGKFIEVWRQKEAALQNSQLTRLLLANSAHEVRTPLNAIINYLEIALEGSLDTETRENLAKSHSASKSLIYVINDLLDLTKTVEGGELVKGDVFDLKATLQEATDLFKGDARRKNIEYEITEYPGIPQKVIGDQRRIRQAISNITANAIQHTTEGSVKVDMYVTSWVDAHVEVEVVVQDTGTGMSTAKLDALFQELEQVQGEGDAMPLEDALPKTITDGKEKGDKRALGLGLAVVARIIKNMNGQLRLKSEEGKGSRFVVNFPFDLPDSEVKPDNASSITETPSTVVTPQFDQPNEVTLIQRDANAPQRPSSSARGVEGVVQRRNSADSLGSRKSLKSLTSVSSTASGKSDVDRLIEAIQEPHGVNNRPALKRVGSAMSTRSRIESNRSGSFGSSSVSPVDRPRARSIEAVEGLAADRASGPRHLRSPMKSEPGTHHLPFSLRPVKAVRMPEEFEASSPVDRLSNSATSGSIVGELSSSEKYVQSTEKQLTADNMHVLVAEDDPVNSKIVKKRLEKAGHNIHLTVNGEECASAYGDGLEKFDVVLMDMQMPIVDGLSSTKMIRAHEKTHGAESGLSERASRNGRVPIIAVSASLIEKERQTYIDAGFDAWILKPIAFARLSELLEGIVNDTVREGCLYKPGGWEKGGWFHMGSKSAWDVNTAASGEKPSMDGATEIAEAENPDISTVAPVEDGTDQERERLKGEQDKGKEATVGEDDQVPTE
ncbi:hypothetical protein EJ05DRAFT_113435 [Pseudovirgaria hyperparasitica]|uniref:Cyanobacterial phytochrome B n=1 Tax=Pseudovirgaria hyperparasitica TaxID=470096 RepID=A0A6A6W0R1_9PEZI|nr:uncharacterized protein EJ05DRAFT_113435 [Pseudovirgaria hyperparasitica]KAF2755729.1 hypothetical protein EJ05DRAFT_113435 [Pseudovirgaria hyperparasitica]